MTLRDFCDWLAATPLSNWEKETVWFIPMVQTLHIIAITLVVSSALLANLRLIRIIGRDSPAKEYVERFEPWIWWPVLVLLLTGSLLTIAEPARELINDVFRIKMVLLVINLTICWFLYRPFRQLAAGDPEPVSPVQTGAAIVSLCLWVSIVFAGRWIAYVFYG